MAADSDHKRASSQSLSPTRSSTPDEEERIAQLVKEQPKSSWKSHLWDTFNKSPEERRFLFKLDAVLLTFASLGYFIKYLDQVNINNAFVSGMKEDLGLFGNELNYMQICWTVGYVVGEIPR
jgi:ACS family pantothenate transporter-like MFS transporter